MSLPVVEQTWPLFLSSKALWRWREGSCQAHFILGWFIYITLLAFYFLHFLLCPPPTLPTQTHTCTSVLSPICPFPLSTTACCLWVQAQIHHVGVKLTGGINPIPPSCHAVLLQNPSPLPLLPHLHPYLCPHPSSPKLPQGHWQGSTVADGCCYHRPRTAGAAVVRHRMRE